MSLLLNRTTAPHVLRFFDLCFKQGVIDACAYGNDLDTKEFLEAKEADWSFGTLEQPDDYDWQAFRYWAYWLARRNGMKTLAENYFFRIRSHNYVWCVLPYAMRFYLMGIREWLRYPNPVGIEMFKSQNRIHWDPNEKTKAITKPDIISYLHEFEFQYRRLDIELQPVSETAMSSFIQALFDLSRKYVTGKTEEDI